MPALQGSLGLWMNWQIHDSIKPNKKEIDKVKFTTPSKPLLQDFEIKHASAFPQNLPKVAIGVDKDSIISLYTSLCRVCGISNQVSTTKKGETLHFPQHHHLISNCMMPPSLDLQYHVQKLSIKNVLIFVMSYTYQVKT